MPYTHCLHCNKERYVKPSHISKGWGKYCSHSCQAKHSQSKGAWFPCHECNKQVWRAPADQVRSKSGLFFCSRKCSMSWKNSALLSRENHPNWNGGEASYRAYLEKTGREKICAHCKLADARVLVAHHIDRNRKNNTAENLMWLCQNCHCLEHLANNGNAA